MNPEALANSSTSLAQRVSQAISSNRSSTWSLRRPCGHNTRWARKSERTPTIAKREAKRWREPPVKVFVPASLCWETHIGVVIVFYHIFHSPFCFMEFLSVIYTVFSQVNNCCGTGGPTRHISFSIVSKFMTFNSKKSWYMLTEMTWNELTWVSLFRIWHSSVLGKERKTGLFLPRKTDTSSSSSSKT